MEMKKLEESFKRFTEKNNVDSDIHVVQKEWEDNDGDTLAGVFKSLAENAELHPFLLVRKELKTKTPKQLNDILSTFHEIREDYLFVKEQIDSYFLQVFKAMEWFKSEALKEVEDVHEQ